MYELHYNEAKQQYVFITGRGRGKRWNNAGPMKSVGYARIKTGDQAVHTSTRPNYLEKEKQWTCKRR